MIRGYLQMPVTLSQKDCAEPASHPQIPRTRQNFKLGSRLEEHHLWIWFNFLLVACCYQEPPSTFFITSCTPSIVPAFSRCH